MKIYLGTDHRGFSLKKVIKEYLSFSNHEVVDCGAAAYDAEDDYPDFARVVAHKVAGDAGSRGILMCGSGVGVAIVANKIKGIRAATLHDARQALMARADEDINICALSADFIDAARAKEIIDAFLTTLFSHAPRHARRIAKIE